MDIANIEGLFLSIDDFVYRIERALEIHESSNTWMKPEDDIAWEDKIVY